MAKGEHPSVVDYHLLGTCLFIAGGRIIDVTLGTVRTIMVVQGRRYFACFLGFCEVTIWLFIAARAIHHLPEHPLYAIAYGLGFAAGNFLGVTVEGWIALGNQMLLVFSQFGPEIATVLRNFHLRVTEFEGRGRDGPVTMLLLVVKRQESSLAVQMIRELDPDCFYLLEDIRFASKLARQFHTATGWRAILKKK